jgi:hypothetical protein
MAILIYLFSEFNPSTNLLNAPSVRSTGVAYEKRIQSLPKGEMWLGKRLRRSGNPQADASRSAWEKEIDRLVAPRQLYGLKEEEIKIVEEK